MKTFKINLLATPVNWVRTVVNPHNNGRRNFLLIEGFNELNERIHFLQFEGYTPVTALALFIEHAKTDLRYV